MQTISIRNKRIWIPFAVALLAGMLVHFTVYANGLVNPDGLWQGEYSVAGPWEAGLGRWGLYFVDLLHGGVNSAPLIALMTVAYIALAGTLVASLFQVKSLVRAIAIPTALTCSPMVSMFLTYPYCADAYALSILLGVLAVYAIHAIPGRVAGTAVGTVCVALLLGLYQSSLGVMLAVAAGYALMHLLRAPEELRALGGKALRGVIAVVAGIALYYGLMYLALWVWGVPLSDYRGAGDVSLLGIVKNIPQGIRDAYNHFKLFFLQDTIAKNAYYTVIVYCVLAGTGLVSLGLRLAAARPKSPYVTALCIVILPLLPIACNIISLMVPGTEFYLLMAGGMMMVPPLLIALGDVPEADAPRLRRAVGKCSVVAAFALVWVFTLSCQTDASVMLANKNQTTALAGRIWQQVEASEGYTPEETPVLVAGVLQEGNYPNPSQLADKANVYANWGMIWASYDGSIHTWAELFRQSLGVTYARVTTEAFTAIAATDAFREMPLYPEDGSVRTIDGVLVVKVSDTADWGN